jgi:plastocyanin
MVGTAEDPEAFEITLMDESGEKVTELPAGDYTIEVTDPAESHNFHLTGGSVDESTSVPETVETTWEVTLEPGEYTYRCDPHPPMTGSFTVT